MAPTKEASRNEEPITQGWSLFDPSSNYFTEDYNIAIHFLECKGVREVEVFDLDGDNFTLFIKGSVDKKDDPSNVIYRARISDLTSRQRLHIVRSMLDIPDYTWARVKKLRVSESLALYLHVWDSI